MEGRLTVGVKAWLGLYTAWYPGCCRTMCLVGRHREQGSLSGNDVGRWWIKMASEEKHPAACLFAHQQAWWLLLWRVNGFGWEVNCNTRAVASESPVCRISNKNQRNHATCKKVFLNCVLQPHRFSKAWKWEFLVRWNLANFMPRESLAPEPPSFQIGGAFHPFHAFMPYGVAKY